MNKLLILIIEFFKTGLFSLGGGLATIPFLKDIGLHYKFFDFELLVKMIAISESTPGPIGVNMATYVGYVVAGVMGSIVSTISLVTPSVVIVVLVAKFLKNANENQKVKNIFYLLRPAVIALITSVLIPIMGISFFKDQTVQYLNIIIAVILLLIFEKTKCHPILIIILAAVIGIMLNL